MQPIHPVKYIFVKSITNSILCVLTFYTRHVTYFRNVCNKHLLLLLPYVIGCEILLPYVIGVKLYKTQIMPVWIMGETKGLLYY